MTQVLLVLTFAVPLALLALCLSSRVRARMVDWLWLAPLPGLATALFARGTPFVLDERLRLTLELRAPGQLLLLVASLLWIAAGFFARTWLRGDPKAPRFAEWWLMTLAGSLGIFVVGDLFTFYTAYALVSLPAWGLVAYDETAGARRAGAIYLVFAVIGEILLLLAFGLLAYDVPGDTLAIRDVVSVLPALPGRALILALLVAGFGLKIGLVPLHVWMPLTYAASPYPAAAVQSGAAVKAGVIGLILFLPIGTPLPDAGTALIVIGFFAAFYGVALGVTQTDPKAVLAYSSISQMGGLTAILGAGLATGNPVGVSAVALSAGHHVLVKGGLFLALGVAAAGGARIATVLAPAAILALALAGLPLTSGAFAKLAAKIALGEGAAATLATFASAGTALLMLHFVFRLQAVAPRDPRPMPVGLLVPWLAIALAAVGALWVFAHEFIADVLTPRALWESSWPVALGAALALVLRRFGPLPAVPPGDLVVLGAPLARIGGTASDLVDRADARLREWPAASVALLALAVALGAALLTGT